VKSGSHRIVRFPESRQFTLDVGRIGARKHHIKALVEVDVTDSRKKIRSKRNESGDLVTFTSWALSCIARAVTDHPQVHALRSGRNRLVIFDEVDISLAVEKMVDGHLVPIPLVIRNAGGKSLSAIGEEIEHAKQTHIADSDDYVLESGRKNAFAGLFAILPQWIRLIGWKILLANPFRVKRLMGTVRFTSVGMMGRVPGWAVPYGIHPLCFTLGSVIKKPGVVGDDIAIREFLEMTILIDHDAVDGAPAARFVAALTRLMESGYGL